MAYNYRPPVTVRLYTTSEADDPGVDITADVLAWNVTFGTDYDPSTGRFRLITARGSITVDNASARYDPRSASATISATVAAIPRPIEIRLGTETLWAGLAVVTGSALLTPARSVTWQLRGRWWQPLRTPYSWTQPAPVDTTFAQYSQAPDTVANAMLRDLRVDWPLTRVKLSPATNVTGIEQYLRYVEADGTLARIWNDVAWASGCIPFEDRSGLLGLSAPALMSADRLEAAPAGQRARAESVLETVPTEANWQLVIGERDMMRGTTPKTAQSERFQTSDTSKRFFFSQIILPDAGVWGYEWGKTTFDAAATILNETIRPLSQARRDWQPGAYYWAAHFTLGTTQPTRASIAGTPLTLNAGDVRRVTVAGAQEVLTLRDQEPPPWAVWDTATVGGRTFTPSAANYEAMAQVLNEPKAMARLVYDLWAPSLLDSLIGNLAGNEGQLVPGRYARYRVDADTTIDMIATTVTLRGAAGEIPKAEIAGITYSGGGGDTSGLPISPTIPDTSGIPVPPVTDTAPIPDPPAHVSRGGLFVAQRNDKKVYEVDTADGTLSKIGPTNDVEFSNLSVRRGIAVGASPSLDTLSIMNLAEPASAFVSQVPDGVTLHAGRASVGADGFYFIGVQAGTEYLFRLETDGTAGGTSWHQATAFDRGAAHLRAAGVIVGNQYVFGSGPGLARLGFISLADGTFSTSDLTGGVAISIVAGAETGVHLYNQGDDKIWRVGADFASATELTAPIDDVFRLKFGNDHLYALDTRRLYAVNTVDGTTRLVASVVAADVAVAADSAPENPPRLTSLTVTDYDLRPQFHAEIGEYEVFVPTAFAGSVRVTGVGADGATVTGNGAVTLTAGEELAHTVRVTDDDGNAVDYQVTFRRV